MSKTLLFTTSFCSSIEEWNERVFKWFNYFTKSTLHYNKLLIVDDGSSILPEWNEVELIDKPFIDEPLSKSFIFHFNKNLGRPAHLDYPGWFRSFNFAARYALKFNYDKVIHIESDAYLLSERIFNYFNNNPMNLGKNTFLLIPIFLCSIVTSFAQNKLVIISGTVKSKSTKSTLPFVNILLKTAKDSAFVTGTISNDEGAFSLFKVKPGNYLLEFSYIGFKAQKQSLFVGSLSDYLEIPPIFLEESISTLKEVTITGNQDEIDGKMDKKTFSVENKISQGGGSVLQTMQNLPGITVQDGKVQLRGNDKIIVLIDGKQTALTGMGSQTGLDNIPASAIDKIEIINNPSAKYDANGNAGIINIIYKKNNKEGLNGKVGLMGGLGSLWLRKENLPSIRPQYQFTPKVNPSLSLNYRKNKVNIFFQGDYLYTQTLNKNEFVTRTYDDGTIIQQQTKRNRNTHFATAKAGIDYAINERNSLTVSALYGMEKILDHGDEPFFNADLSQRLRLWQFLEDELKTTIMASTAYQHKYKQPGHLMNIGLNYTFHREDEKYFFDKCIDISNHSNCFKFFKSKSKFYYVGRVKQFQNSAVFMES